VSTEDEIRDWSHRLDEAAQGPEGLRSAHLRTGSPRKVDEGRRSQRKLDTRRDKDSRALPAGEVAPSLLGGHSSMLFRLGLCQSAAARSGWSGRCESPGDAFVSLTGVQAYKRRRDIPTSM
jgi:hypothetical protein